MEERFRSSDLFLLRRNLPPQLEMEGRMNKRVVTGLMAAALGATVAFASPALARGGFGGGGGGMHAMGGGGMHAMGGGGMHAMGGGMRFSGMGAGPRFASPGFAGP